MARPHAKIDIELLEKLASHGCSAEQIGAILNVNHRTIERRFAPILKKGRHQRDGRLQVKLFQEAMGTPCNTAIAIFLAKNWLGMTDRPEVSVNVQAVANAAPVGPPLLDAKAKRKLEDLAVAIQKRALSRAMRELTDHHGEQNGMRSYGHKLEDSF